jgi:NAD(P)-dependent dehydrogenase (short-subunit alcohol dehydrogenase family)
MMLAGKVALITGGGSGIGRAIALAFARHGAFSIVLDQNIAAAENVAQEIGRMGGQSFAIQADVASMPQVSRAFEEVLKHTKTGYSSQFAECTFTKRNHIDRV